MSDYPFLLNEELLRADIDKKAASFRDGQPFPHIVIDHFPSEDHIRFLVDRFPVPTHPVWLDWRVRSPHHYGKLGPGDSSKFALLEPAFLMALQEFNSWKFLNFLEALTGIQGLIPDPYFSGGGLHQIITGGILDIHTDFNDYKKLQLYRRLNVLIYLNEDWEESWNGCLEFWDGGAANGKCVKSIAPLLNRAVVFETDKASFHGHPVPWNAPNETTRKSIALYYYTAWKKEFAVYDGVTDFQGISTRPLPAADSDS